MTLEEYAVEKIKELECRKVELEVSLKRTEENYKSANSTIKKLREENEMLKYIIGHYDNGSDIGEGGNIRIYVSDSWKSYDLTEEEVMTREQFNLCAKIIKEYRELHPKPKEEGE